MRKKITQNDEPAPPKATKEAVLASTQDAMELVRTKVIDFSFNELYDMYRSDELEINPAYQRLFRWGIAKQSQFIESLILELPIPPIYVVEEEGGKYELIDGLQRFSSYLHLRGMLKKDGQTQPPLILEGCDILKQLNGLTYDDLPTPIQIRLKRMSVPVQVLRKESDRRLRYHMFKRLNTGGEALSEQEVRNATIRLLGDRFNNFIQELAKHEDFALCVDLMTDEQKDRMVREECVLRFFAFKNDFANYHKLITPFLDDFMERMTDGPEAETFDYAHEASVFRQTFSLFATTTRDQTFSTVTKSNTLGNQFSMAHYDMLTQGVQKHLNKLITLNGNDRGALGEQIIALKKDKKFRQDTTGGGKNYKSAYRNTIEYVEKWIARWLRTA
ncbi:MAG: DUF262 domain-containing protein [Minicystis sp.]